MSFEDEIEQLMKEDDALKGSIALNKILHSLLIESKREKMCLCVVILCLIATIAAGIVSFFIYESQFEIEETETTYSYAEASGENAAINNVQGDQYNDQATRNNYYGGEEGDE